MIRTKLLATIAGIAATVVMPLPSASATHSWTVPKSGSAGGCALGGVQTCSASVSMTATSAPNSTYCLGSPGAWTWCRVHFTCNGSGTSNLAATVHLQCAGGGSSSCTITGVAGGTCSPSQRSGYSIYVASGSCVTLGGTTTTANALGSASVTRSILFCPDATGPAYW